MFCEHCSHCNQHKLTNLDCQNIERALPPGEINLQKCFAYLLMHFGKDYDNTIRAIYKMLIWGRITKDLRMDKFLEEVKAFAQKHYDSMSFDDDCPQGEMISVESSTDVTT